MLKSTLPPLTWLRAFEASARHLSFTLAAEELNLTQSAISQHVRNLEDYLGCHLFIRKTRAIQLTREASNYLPTIREAFDLISSGTRNFTGSKQNRTLALQCNLAFATYWLTPRLKNLYAMFPWLTLNIITTTWNPKYKSKNSVLEIRFGRESDMPPKAMKLTTDYYYPVCRPDFAHGEPDWQSSLLFDCSGLIGNWDTWLDSQSLALPEDKKINLSSSNVVILSAALNGVGIAMTHDSLATVFLNRQELIRPFKCKLEMPENYYLLRPNKYSETESSQAFTTWLKSELNLNV